MLARTTPSQGRTWAAVGPLAGALLLAACADRRQSRRIAFDPRCLERHAAPLGATASPTVLRILFDRSTLEVFADGGAVVLSDRVFPTRALDRLEIVGDGRATVKVWPLASAIDGRD